MNHSWQQLLTLTESMLDTCERQDWQGFAEQERQRLELMNKLRDVDSENTQEDIEVIKEVILLTQQLIKQTDKIKEEASQSLLALRRKAKLSDKYKSSD